MKHLNDNFKHSLNKDGFSLVELLIVLLIISVISGAIYSVFSYSNLSYTQQNVSAEVQQKLRAAMEIIIQDIRTAGLDPTASGVFGIEHADEQKLRFTSDSIDTGLGEFNGVIDDNNSERMTYVFESNQLTQTLYENTANEISLPLIQDVNSLKFSYTDADGNDLGCPVDPNKLKDIRAIEISLTLNQPAGRKERITRSLTKRIKCRNLGLR